MMAIIKHYILIALWKNCNKRRLAQGGGVAAPVGGQIFREVLPYLEIQRNSQEKWKMHIKQWKIM